MSFEFCRCLLNSEFPIQNWAIQNRLADNSTFNIPNSKFFFPPEGKITPCRGCNLQICITLAKLIHSRVKSNSCCARCDCLLCVMCKGRVGSSWSLRSLVIKVIKDFESVKLCLYNYIFLIYNYIESDLHFFFENDLND